MRWRAAIVTCVVGRAVHAEPPPVEEEIARAARAGKVLVVELSAEWCPPCRTFEDKVLPQSAVIDALKDVEFVQYDVDTPVGEAVSLKYRTPVVPTFIVLGDDGSEIARQVGLPPLDRAAKTFIDLIGKARLPRVTIAQLEAAATTHPDDAAAQLALAGHYRAAGRTDAALERYRAVASLPGASRDAAATAALAIDDLVNAAARVDAAVQAAEAFVQKFPDSPAASRKLAILGLSGRVSPERVRELVAAHLAAVAKRDLPNAVRVALLVGATDEANRAVRSWLDDDPALPDAFLLEAEVSLQQGDARSAQNEVTTICGMRLAYLDAWCYSLIDALNRNRRAPVIQHMRSAAQAYLRDLENPGVAAASDADVGRLAALDRDLGNAIVRLIVTAEARCNDIKHVDDRATAVFTLAAPGGAPSDVQVYAQRDREVAKCLRDELAHRALPPATDGERSVVVPLYLAQQTRVPWVPSPATASGAFVGLASRAGTMSDIAIATTGTIDVHRFHELHAIAGWQAEYGADTNDGTTSWLIRGVAGIGYAPSPSVALSLATGIGGSKLGATFARAGEIPIEARLRLTWGDLRLQLFVQAINEFGQPARQGNEYAIGAYESGRVFGLPRCFLAWTYEYRPGGSTMFAAVGYPIGGY